ncbi:MAG: hypothetical protein ACI9SC_000684 [Gammaproteobacteria bacterium]|jgi:hypothetical protein
MRKLIPNFILFQTAWFITIFSAVSGHPYIGPVYTVMWMMLHLTFFTDQRFEEWRILFFAAVLGYIFDSLLVYMDVFTFPPQALLGSPSTIWMIALWVNLAATLNFSLKWLQGRLVLAALLGAIAGPATYYAGSRIGAIELQQAWSLLAISMQWLIAMPLLLWFAQRGLRPLHQTRLINETNAD